MSDPNDPLAWVARAEEDFLLAITACRRSPPLIYGACFHAQQTAEKYLKGVLVSRRLSFPLTHDLNGIYALCLRASLPLAVQRPDLIALQTYAVEIRYPGPTPTGNEARRAVLSAARVRRACRRFLGLP